ncbi:MAG TPA: hypothetical protein VN282_20905 [Pyrinomonadaceae bacterium]|nr:hypothetical protein [Pyrinomonadaceae bacterium]
MELRTERGRYTPTTFSGKVGAFELSDVPVLLYKGYGAPTRPGARFPKLGTIGLDIFRERVLILDFPKRRFALLNKGEGVPADVERRAQFFEVAYRDGWLFLPVVSDGRPVGNVIYDTGASVYPLVIRRELWRRLTGRTSDEPDNERRVTSSWGRSYVMTGAPTLKALSVGPLVFPESTAFYGPAEAPHLSFERRPRDADGLVGNAPFYDAHGHHRPPARKDGTAAGPLNRAARQSWDGLRLQEQGSHEFINYRLEAGSARRPEFRCKSGRRAEPASKRSHSTANRPRGRSALRRLRGPGRVRRASGGVLGCARRWRGGRLRRAVGG